jgi:hypothetical protein
MRHLTAATSYIPQARRIVNANVQPALHLLILELVFYVGDLACLIVAFWRTGSQFWLLLDSVA